MFVNLSQPFRVSGGKTEDEKKGSGHRHTALNLGWVGVRVRVWCGWGYWVVHSYCVIPKNRGTVLTVGPT